MLSMSPRGVETMMSSASSSPAALASMPLTAVAVHPSNSPSKHASTPIGRSSASLILLLLCSPLEQLPMASNFPQVTTPSIPC
jgi:hypothetical protein